MSGKNILMDIAKSELMSSQYCILPFFLFNLQKHYDGIDCF